MENIVIITIDSLRVDGSAHNCKVLNIKTKLRTPNLDSITRNGTSFINAYSTNTYTTAAHASLFTGVYPMKHKIRGFFDLKRKRAMVVETRVARPKFCLERMAKAVTNPAAIMWERLRRRMK